MMFLKEVARKKVLYVFVRLPPAIETGRFASIKIEMVRFLSIEFHCKFCVRIFATFI